MLSRIAEPLFDSREKLDVATPPPATASSDVLAFVSLARLASGDGSVADVLALSSNLVRDIVPNATGAWYLTDPGRDRLTVAGAFGPAASALAGVSVGVGQRLTGCTDLSVSISANSDAALDFYDPRGCDGRVARRRSQSLCDPDRRVRRGPRASDRDDRPPHCRRDSSRRPDVASRRAPSP